MTVRIDRDVSNRASVVTIIKNNRKLVATLDSYGISFEGAESLFPSIAEALQMDYPYSQPFASRPAWYDRNPKSIPNSWSSTGKSPHGATAQYTYTCPEDRNAIIEQLQARIERVTVAAPANTVRAYFVVQPYGSASGFTQLLAMLLVTENAAGDKENVVLGSAITLYPGDILYGMSADASTGGTVNYYLISKITEFDA